MRERAETSERRGWSRTAGRQKSTVGGGFRPCIRQKKATQAWHSLTSNPARDGPFPPLTEQESLTKSGELNTSSNRTIRTLTNGNQPQEALFPWEILMWAGNSRERGPAAISSLAREESLILFNWVSSPLAKDSKVTTGHQDGSLTTRTASLALLIPWF